MALGTVIRFAGRSAGKRGPYKQTGLLGLGEGLPPRVSGRQRALEVVPDKCPHCGAEDQLFQDQVMPRRVYCFCCSRDWWLVRAGNGHGDR